MSDTALENGLAMYFPCASGAGRESGAYGRRRRVVGSATCRHCPINAEKSPEVCASSKRLFDLKVDPRQ